MNAVDSSSTPTSGELYLVITLLHFTAFQTQTLPSHDVLRKVSSWGSYLFNNGIKIASPIIYYFTTSLFRTTTTTATSNHTDTSSSTSSLSSSSGHPIQPLLSFHPSYQFGFHLSHRDPPSTCSRRHQHSTRSRSKNPRHYYLMKKMKNRRSPFPPKLKSSKIAVKPSFLRHLGFLLSSSFGFVSSHLGAIQTWFNSTHHSTSTSCSWSDITSSLFDDVPSTSTSQSSSIMESSSSSSSELSPDVDVLTLHRLSTMLLPFDKIAQSWTQLAKQECTRLHTLLYSCSDHVLPGSYISPSSIFLSQHDERQVPIVIDTGASTGLSPFKEDFISYTPQKSSISGIAHESEVLGVGTVRWEVLDVNGVKNFIETEAFHVPSAVIRLYSPQAHFRKHRSGSLIVTHSGCHLELPSASTSQKPLKFPFNHFNGLPLMLRAPSDSTSSTALIMDEDLTYSMSAAHGSSPSLPSLPFSAEMYPTVSRSEILEALDEQYGCNAGILDARNKNLRSAQVELLKWHFRLGHINMHSIQRLMCHSKSFDNHDTSDELCHPRIIPTKFKTTSTCEIPKCAACILGKMERIPKSTTWTKTSTNGRLFDGTLSPGQCISMDQYVVSQKGRTLTNSSRDHLKYNGGTLFIDHASSKIFNHLQISLRSGETLVGKRVLEHAASDLGIAIKGLRSDNGIFVSDEFLSDCRRKGQRLKRCGVGAHHQNGVAERFIKTICYLTRAQMIHAAICWPKRADMELWPFAFDHAVYLYNHLPGKDGLSPEERWTGVKHRSFRHIRRLHPWGCPAYVLDPKLQDGQKLPKWNPRSRQGQFLGYSKDHATNVGLILNPRTKRISPQFHVLYDDFFTTVCSADDACEPSFTDGDWDALIRRSGGTENVFDDNDSAVPPRLDPEWDDVPPHSSDNGNVLPPAGNPAPAVQPGPPLLPPLHQRENHEVFENDEQGEQVQDHPQHSPQVQREPQREIQREPQREPQNESDEEPIVENQNETNDDHPLPLRRSRRLRKQNKRYYNDDFVNNATSSSVIPSFHTISRAMEELKRKSTKFDSHLDYINNLDWDTSFSALAASSTTTQSQQFFANLSQYEDPVTNCLDESHPLALAAKANDADNPRWREATNGENSEGFWDAMWKEIRTLEDKHVWEQVPRDENKRVIPVTWAFKIKRFPSGLVRKLKARICARGDLQEKGIDYFESFAPVVSWTTVRTLLILSVMLGLRSSQVDYVAAFCQAPMDKETYIDLPQGWQHLNRMGGLKEPFKPGHVLKLNKSIYGLCESPSNFFNFLKKNLEKSGFKQSSNDPCLFISPTVICLVYVDDCLFFSKSQKHIDESIEAIRACGMELNKEDDAAGFLGVQIKKNQDGTISLFQSGLTDRIIEAMGLSDSNEKSTAAPQKALGRDLNGEPFSQEFNYASVVGMLLYLCNNSRPDISFAVSQCARYTHNPTALHAQYLKHIGRYLKGTRDKGLILDPTGNPLDIDCYVDADFAGLWDPETQADPHCVRSRSGWVILIGGCPVIWKSKLISEICLSTMESEYISLSKSCRDLLPLQRLVKELGDALHIASPGKTTIKCTIWEDNQAALKLATLELPYMTNRSKHIAIKYHWFRSHVGKEWEVRPIDTKQQIADMFTKGLPRDTFQYLRKLLMGW